MIHLATVALPPVAAIVSRAPARSGEAAPANTGAGNPKASDGSVAVAQDRNPKDDEGQDKKAADGFGDILNRALHQQDAPPAATTFKIRIAPPSLTGLKTQKAPSNEGSSGATAALVQTPETHDATALPLCFSFPSGISANAMSERPGTSKNAAPTSSQAPVESVDGKAESAESLQVEQQTAFTARIRPAGDAEPSAATALKNENNTDAEVKPDFGSIAPEAAAASAIAATVASSTAAPHAAAAPAGAGMPAAVGAPVSHAIAETPPPEAVSRPEALHNISFQLPGARGVEVRLSDQGGEIRVDVRSADPALTQNLRGNLHELVTGLEHKGFTAQVSHAGEASSGSSADSSSAKQQSPEDQGGGSGRRQRDPDEKEQSSDARSPRTRAAWTEALNANFETPA